MRELFRLFMLAAFVAAVAIAASCGKSGEKFFGESGGRLLPPEILSAMSAFGRTTSGLPSGIRLTWTRSDEPTAEGYYLYRDTSPIAGGREGDESIRVNGGAMIPQAPDDPIVFDDTEFPGGNPVVGQTYYYRVTVVDTAGEESFFSPEFAYTVREQEIAEFVPVSGGYGTTVTITGIYFANFDEQTDAVHFSGMTGTVPAEVISWTNTEIEAAVPDFAITGPIFVIIDGTIAASEEDFVVTSPHLTGTSKDHAAENEAINLFGANLGATQGSSTVAFAGQEAAPQVVSWSPTQITVRVPPIDADANFSTISVAIAGVPLDAIDILIDPLITAPAVLRATPGEQVTISGKHFGTSGTLLVSDSPVAANIWTPTEIVAVVIGTWNEGPVVVLVDHPSNSIQFILDEEVFFEFPEGFEGSVFERGTLYEIGVSTNSNVESMEFLINGAFYRQDADPSNGFKFTLDPDDLTNNRHNLSFRATRRGHVYISGEKHFFARVFDGDYNGDNEINELDVQALADFWINVVVPFGDNSASLFPTLDGNRDGVIDERDAAIIGYLYGESRIVPFD